MPSRPTLALLTLLLATNASLALHPARGADDALQPPVHWGQPHRVLIGDDSKKIIAIVDAQGEIEWQAKVNQIHDAWLLPTGNVLYQTDWQHLVEVQPGGKQVWSYDAGKMNGNEGQPVEVHAFQRLPGGATMIAEGGRRRIIEVDRDGNLLKQIALRVLDTSDAHHDTRLARKVASGHYLVAHEGDNKMIREYDADGKVVWEYAPGSKAYSAIRLAGGNTLIGGGDGHWVREVNPAGAVVWSVNRDDLPGIMLAWVTMVERLPNGNTVICNCHAGPDNPQILEVTPEKKVVWTFKDYQRFGNSLPVARVLDAAGK